MLVYFIRHGESETNLSKKWTGWLDAPLTQRGIEDAKKAGDYIKNTDFDKIYSSDLSRAVDTAKNAIPGCDPETTALLREINVGNITGKPLEVGCDEQNNKSDFSKFDGESHEVFLQRINKFLKSLEDKPYKNVAAFSHGGVLLALLDIILETEVPRKKITCLNCAILICEYKDGIWKLNSLINIM